jgi:hypothetical protein
MAEQVPTVSFRGSLDSMRGGGHAIAVDPGIVAPIGAKHATRVRGVIGDAPFRSNLVKTGDTLWLGIHRATVEAAGLAIGDEVDVRLEIDDAPLPTDTVPPDLAAALAKDPGAAAAWERLAPSHRRAHVASILDAKRPPTRERRIAATIVPTSGRATTTSPHRTCPGS